MRKSVTFSIDDGYLSFDKRFLDIPKPVGFLGTFNLCSDRATFEDKDYARALYLGYEIGNKLVITAQEMREESPRKTANMICPPTV